MCSNFHVHGKLVDLISYIECKFKQRGRPIPTNILVCILAGDGNSWATLLPDQTQTTNDGYLKACFPQGVDLETETHNLNGLGVILLWL